jgi:hypothetical protein
MLCGWQAMFVPFYNYMFTIVLFLFASGDCKKKRQLFRGGGQAWNHALLISHHFVKFILNVKEIDTKIFTIELDAIIFNG